MRGRQTLSSVTTYEGEAKPARRQHIGNSTRRLSSEMGIEKCATQRPAFDGGKSIADGTYGADDCDPSILERRDNIEGNEELILHNENGMCACHFALSFAFDSSITALCLGYAVMR